MFEIQKWPKIAGNECDTSDSCKLSESSGEGAKTESQMVMRQL